MKGLGLDLAMLDQLKPLLSYPAWQKLTALAGVALLLVASYVYFFWLPVGDEIESLQASITEQLQTLERNQAIADQLPKKKQEYEQLVKDLNVALNMLPRKSQIENLLADVSWAGKDAGLEFSVFQPKDERVREIYAEVPVEISVNGSFRQLLSFLKRVGEMPRIVDVKRLSIAPGEEPGMLAVAGSVVTYRFVENGASVKNAPRPQARGR